MRVSRFWQQLFCTAVAILLARPLAFAQPENNGDKGKGGGEGDEEMTFEPTEDKAVKVEPPPPDR